MNRKTLIAAAVVAFLAAAPILAQEQEESRRLSSMMLVTDYESDYDGAWFLVQAQPETLVVRIYHGISDKETCSEDMFYFTGWSYLTLSHGAIYQSTLKGSCEMYHNEATYAGGEYEYSGDSDAWLNLVEDNTTIYIYFGCRGGVYEARIDKDRDNPLYATALAVSDKYADGWRDAEWSFFYYLGILGLASSSQ